MRRFGPALLFVAALGLSVAVGANAAPFAYIPNASGNDVSVIDPATNAVVSAQSLGGDPFGVAVAPDGSRVYVTNHSPAVLVIDTATNSVVQAVRVGSTADQTHGVAVTPDGARVYVTTISEQPYGHFGVAVIDTATNTV